MSNHLDKSPLIPDSCFIAEGAKVIANVKLGEKTSIWYNAVLRGDIAAISLGEGSNIQDGAIVHVDHNEPTTIGKNVSVGHGAIVHSATVEDNVLIGMGAILLSGCKIGENSMIAAGAVVRESFEVPAKSLVVGVPGKILRELTDEECQANKDNAKRYVTLSRKYLEQTKTK